MIKYVSVTYWPLIACKKPRFSSAFDTTVTTSNGTAISYNVTASRSPYLKNSEWTTPPNLPFTQRAHWNFGHVRLSPLQFLSSQAARYDISPRYRNHPHRARLSTHGDRDTQLFKQQSRIIHSLRVAGAIWRTLSYTVSFHVSAGDGQRRNCSANDRKKKLIHVESEGPWQELDLFVFFCMEI